MNNVFQKIENSLELTIGEFQKNPFDFLYESDLQVSIVNHLKKSFRDETVKYDISNGKFTKHFEKINPSLTVETSIIKSEYPSNSRSFVFPGAFDIAIIAARSHNYKYEEIKEHILELQHEALWILPLNSAIEIKLLQIGDPKSIRLKGLLKDIEKLIKYEEQYLGHFPKSIQYKGYSLLFTQYSLDYMQTFLKNLSDRLDGTQNPNNSNIDVKVIGPDFLKDYTLR